MTGKRFAVPGGRSGISWLHRCLFVAALIGAWQVIALDRANEYKNNDLKALGAFEAAEPLVPCSGLLSFEATAYCDFGITKSGANRAGSCSCRPVGSSSRFADLS